MEHVCFETSSSNLRNQKKVQLIQSCKEIHEHHHNRTVKRATPKTAAMLKIQIGVITEPRVSNQLCLNNAIQELALYVKSVLPELTTLYKNLQYMSNQHYLN